MLKIPHFIQKNIHNIHKCVKVDIGSKLGPTNYIDFLTKEDFINNGNRRVIYGEDVNKRFFISVLYKQIFPEINNKDIQKTNLQYKDHNIMTLFQRYTNEPSFFVSCGDTFIWKGDIKTHNFCNSVNVIPEQFTNFFTLINNGELNITYNINDLYNLEDEYFDREKTIHYKLGL